MAYKNSHDIKTVTEDVYIQMRMAVPECIQKISECNQASSALQANFLCQKAYYICESKVAGPYFETGLNPYDIRLECGDHPLCYDFSNVMRFMNLDSTRQVRFLLTSNTNFVDILVVSMYAYFGIFIVFLIPSLSGLSIPITYSNPMVFTL